jgi:hypothetical protein
MAELEDMPLKEFHSRLASILGTITTDNIVRMLEINGVVRDGKVEINRLQGTFESLFQDAGVLLINEIVKQPYVAKERLGNKKQD